MSLKNVQNHLKKYNLDKNIIVLNESSATVSLAAHALKCREEEIAKTMSFIVNDNYIVIVIPGNRKIDNKKYKETFKTKAKMVPIEDLETNIGHIMGGVCPFGLKENVQVYLDVSLKNYHVVYPAAGEANTAVKLTLEELIESSEFKEWIDVCKIVD